MALIALSDGFDEMRVVKTDPDGRAVTGEDEAARARVSFVG